MFESPPTSDPASDGLPAATTDHAEEFGADFLWRLKNYDSAAWQRAFAVLHPIAFRGAAQAQTHLPVQDIEEVAGDALVELAQHIAGLDTWPQVAARAFVTARRRAVDRLRHLRAQKRHVADAVHIPLDTTPAHELAVTDAGMRTQWTEISLVVEGLIAGLGEPAATLVRGYAKDGLSYEQLSQRANMPLGTVAAIIYRSLRRLERDLGGSSKLGKELSLYL